MIRIRKKDLEKLIEETDPKEVIEYGEFKVSIYSNGELTAFVAFDLDGADEYIGKSIEEAEIVILNEANLKHSTAFEDLLKGKGFDPLKPPMFDSIEEYLAFVEKEERKKENVNLLAKSYRDRSSRKTSIDAVKKIDELISLTPREFESWTKSLFEKKGWKVTETKATGDGGVDLVLEKDNIKSIAQCKRFKGNVGEPLLRDFYGTIMHEGVSEGYFVTTGYFTSDAIKWAEDKPIIRMDRGILISEIKET
ncbi:MAG: hypothetical protein A2126_03625 [Candidatus Woykebacteria bacterium GWB1_45_5]|uniref:Restriction endonuclease type IV Mrr domain-containing protein n=2 Tax=Candidatus Woykeibacteriota TaxID=1817899 RepID=A0A1G1W3V7_9BACT|nr:MAG: hypothetical protein A2113_03390 [Candidatus Woykebacteria bacterium GWA1_44_8]OGY24502.1 MAG: hypothetical protein A2126_03625 [Candidatus Woykebacteria bacterium GWB1_45_5]